MRPAISLGHSLGLLVTGEGVEDQATWDMLAEFKCDVAQGYYMGGPMPAALLTDWLGGVDWQPAEVPAPDARPGRRS